MIAKCKDCDQWHDERKNWTLCPHWPLELSYDGKPRDEPQQDKERQAA